VDNFVGFMLKSDSLVFIQSKKYLYGNTGEVICTQIATKHSGLEVHTGSGKLVNAVSVCIMSSTRISPRVIQKHSQRC